MNSHEIGITETLSRIIEIEETSTEEAIGKAREMYRKEEIVWKRT